MGDPVAGRDRLGGSPLSGHAGKESSMDAYGDEAPSRQLTDYAGVLRRRWWQIVAGALLGVVLAAAATLMMPVRYTSSVSVQVTPTGLPDANTTTTNARTQGTVNLDN